MEISRRLLLWMCLFLLIPTVALHGEPENTPEDRPPVFSTWEGFEVDKCAAIWLIKRFIDERAVIRFFPKGELIQEGIPFDTPDAQFRIYHDTSTFESMLRYYKIEDARLLYIGQIVHDIEINIWEKKRLDETPVVQEGIVQIIRHSKNNDEVIKESCKYFNHLYERIGN